MKIKSYKTYICSLFYSLALLLTACAQTEANQTLTVSVEPQRALLEKIVGDKFAVTTLLTNGANPETFEPTMKSRMAVDDSQIFFKIGNMPFENTIEQSLAPTVKVVDCSQNITPIVGTHGHDGHDASIDPHIWASLPNQRIIARTMLNAVVTIDKANAKYYQANFAVLDSTLAATDSIFATRLANVHCAFAVWHPSLSYFARDYNLTQISVGFENKDMSPVHLVEVTEQAKAAGVKVFFFQKEYDSRQAQSLNDVLKARMVTINPLAYNLNQELSNIVDELTH
jgi:zinc transport system substrate-binding protein